MSEFLPDVAGLAQHGVQAYLVYKVFGPPAGALGQRLERSVDEFHLARFAQVLRAAARKVRVDRAGDAVNERVLGRVLDQSEWVDDEVIVEYLGGVLASAKGPDGIDDRGVVWADLIGRMSRYQLRLHYLIYTLGRGLYEGLGIEPNDGDTLHRGRLYIPYSVLGPALEVALNDDEDEDDDGTANVLGHALFGLARDDLIGADFCSGPATFLRDRGRCPHAPEGGLVVTPTALGAELYLWGHGYGRDPLASWLDLSKEVDVLEAILISDGACRVEALVAIETTSTEDSDHEESAG